MKSKISILIPDGEDDRALIVVRSLACSVNAKIHVLSAIKKSVHLSRYCKFHLIPLSENNMSGRMERIIELANKYNIEVLLPIGIQGLKFIYPNYELLKTHFSIPPIPDIEKFNIVKDKWNLNEFCKEKGFPFLKTAIIQKKQYEIEELDRLPSKLILKIRDGEGGIGIKYFESHDLLLHELNFNNEFLADNDYMIQEYIDGDVISFNAICQGGKILVSSVHQPAIKNSNSFTFARVIELIENEDVSEICKRLLLALEWNGMANIDLIYSKEKEELYFIDFNPRFFGTMLGLTRGGVNYPYLTCLLAINKTIAQPEYRKIVFAILNTKQIIPWLKGKDGFKGVPFKHTNYSFVIDDPKPAIVIGLKGLF